MTFDLGFIKAIHSSPTAPVNTQMLWYDINTNLHKYYDVGGSLWVPLASGASSWSTVLGQGAESNGNSPIISAGDALVFYQGGFSSIILADLITAPRILKLPDNSGVLALLTDITSAGTLNAVLTAGDSTGGKDILMSPSDSITTATGSAFLKMTDGADGFCTLSAINFAKIYSGGYLLLESAGLIILGISSGMSAAISSIGMGINVSPESVFHINSISSTADLYNVDVFKIKENTYNTEMHQGFDTDGINIFNYIQNYSSSTTWMALQPFSFSVSIAMGYVSPTSGGGDIRLGIGNPTVLASNSIAIYTDTASGKALYKTFSGTNQVMEFGHVSGDEGVITNKRAGESIILRATQTLTPVQIAAVRGDYLTFELSKEMTIANHHDPAIVAGPIGILLSTIYTEGKIVATLNFSSAAILSGIDGYYPGRVLILTNKNITNSVKITNASGGAGDAKVYCPGGTDLILGAYESAVLYYDAGITVGNGGWIVIATPNI